jgi:hypothetical protein
MAIYTYSGNKSLSDGTESILVRDTADLIRFVSVGYAVDIDSLTYDRLASEFVLTPGGSLMAPIWTGDETAPGGGGGGSGGGGGGSGGSGGGFVPSGPSALVYYGNPNDSDGTPSDHPEWADQLRASTSPGSVVDQMTYETDSTGTGVRLLSFRENGTVRILTYQAGTDNLVGVS